MKTIVLGGFLGAGKTSILLQIAGYCAARNIRTAIIENEIAKYGMDDQLVRSTGLRVETLFANCICCTGAAEMTVMVNQLGEKIRSGTDSCGSYRRGGSRDHKTESSGGAVL